MGGLVTMAATALGATAAAAVSQRHCGAVLLRDPSVAMAEVEAATVEGSLGAVAAVAVAEIAGRYPGGMAAMLRMASGTGSMPGVSLAHWLRAGDGRA